MVPEEIRLAKARTGITIRWRDGVTHYLGADLLRRHGRSASAIRNRLEGAVPSAINPVRISRVEPVGGYALNLGFSDGEERSIFPWPLLRSLGE